MARTKEYSRRTAAAGSALWAKGGPRLVRLDVELTERCNNACVHCYINRPADDAAARDRELPAATLGRILAEAAELGCLAVRLTGGEPLLRPDFEEIYLTARKLGMGVALFTNAGLVTPAIAGLLKRVPPLRKVEVSVYGMSEASSRTVTGVKGAFEASRRGLRLLQECAVPVVVKGTMLPAVKAEREELVAWARALPRADGPPAFATLFDLHCRRDPKKSRKIRRLRLPPGEAARILADNARFREEIPDFLASFSEAPGPGLFSCGAGLKSACVDAYGTLYPCMMLRSPEAAYDLERGTLRDALDGPFRLLRERTTARPEYLDRCGRCFLKGLCEQCPARSWIEHGDLDSPVEYFCEVTHALAREVGILGPGEKSWESGGVGKARRANRERRS